MSRPLLEFSIAERVRALPNAAVRDGVRIDRLHRDGRNPVAGVRLTSPGTPERTEEIGCDLVVDATGRGSATPRWLAEQGFAPPREDLLPARVTYATCNMHVPARRLRHGACDDVAPLGVV